MAGYLRVGGLIIIEEEKCYLKRYLLPQHPEYLSLRIAYPGSGINPLPGLDVISFIAVLHHRQDDLRLFQIVEMILNKRDRHIQLSVDLPHVKAWIFHYKFIYLTPCIQLKYLVGHGFYHLYFFLMIMAAKRISNIMVSSMRE